LTPNDILNVAEKGDAEETLNWIRQRAVEHTFWFAKTIAGYKDLTPHLHKPVCDWLDSTVRDRGRGLLMPRKYFKSSMVKAWVLKRIVLNPEIRILFVGENDQVGAKNLQDIRWNIQQNPLFQALYPHVIPPDYGKSWSESAITVPRKRSFDEPTIQTVGIGAKHTGFHYDLIVYDDPIGLVAAGSEAEMKRAIEWFQTAPGLLNSVESEELIVGTRWKHGRGDLYGWIMEEMPYHKRRSGDREGYRWYIRSAIENGESIFPRQPSPADPTKTIGYSLRDLELMRQRMGTYQFGCLMLNNPTPKEGADFPDEWIKTYSISEDRRSLITSDTHERIEASSLVRLSVYDPSSGGKQARAENAIVVTGTDRKGRIFVLGTWSKNCGFGKSVEQWHVLNDKWRCWGNWFESVGAHKEVDEIIRMRSQPCIYCGKVHRPIRARAIKPPSGSKEDRIRDLAQPAFEQGRIYIGEGMTKLRRQIIEFPHSEMVDIFDALAYAISKSRKPVIYNTNQGNTEENAKRKVEPRTHSDVAYGGY